MWVLTSPHPNKNKSLKNGNLPTGNKKHEDVKLISKPLIQHNCQQKKAK